MLVVGRIVVSIGAMRTAASGMMRGITGKIVRHVVREIDAMLSAQADERQHELADQDRSTDHRAHQKQQRHGPSSASLKTSVSITNSPANANSCPPPASSGMDCVKSNATWAFVKFKAAWMCGLRRQTSRPKSG